MGEKIFCTIIFVCNFSKDVESYLKTVEIDRGWCKNEGVNCAVGSSLTASSMTIIIKKKK